MSEQGEPRSTGDTLDFRSRTAIERDLDAIWDIERAAFGSEAWSKATLRSEILGDYRRYFVLEDRTGAVHGYAGILAIGGDGDIQTIALDRDVRGAGYGRLLMNELLDEAERREVQQVYLEVRADNPTAHGLYTSLGFTEIGVRPRYYQPDNVDAIVMRLKLEDRR